MTPNNSLRQKFRDLGIIRGFGNSVHDQGDSKEVLLELDKLILDELKAIYLVIPKTGCTSIKKYFSDYYGWEVVENVHSQKSEIYR
jgi:hypothetical protein